MSQGKIAPCGDFVFDEFAHLSTRNRSPQDATKNYLQSRDRLQAVCVWKNRIDWPGVKSSDWGHDACSREWPAHLFWLWWAVSWLWHSAHESPFRFHSIVVDPGRLSLCDAPCGLSHVWRQSWASSLGPRKKPTDDRLQMVPCRLGSPNELEGSSGLFPC